VLVLVMGSWVLVQVLVLVLVLVLMCGCCSWFGAILVLVVVPGTGLKLTVLMVFFMELMVPCHGPGGREEEANGTFASSFAAALARFISISGRNSRWVTPSTKMS